MVAPVLVFAIGNESRGDDALAPLLLRDLDGWVRAEGLDGQVELLEDYQLQIEHVADLQKRNAVLFVDADVSCKPPFQFSAIEASHDNSYSSHAMTPFALLYAYRQVYGADAPPCYLMRVRGYGFELGEVLSAEAATNLELAKSKVCSWLADNPALR